MLLSIVILSYNTPDLVLDSLKSLSKHYGERLRVNELEIIVVDNASEEKNVKKIAEFIKDQKDIPFIKNSQNFGFGRGNNIGAKAARGDFVLFLNSDTEVLDDHFLSMARFMQKDPKIAVSGAKLLNHDGSPQKNSTGKFYNLFNFSVMMLGFERLGFLRQSPKKTQEVDWVAGACMMVRKSLFLENGGFDEKMFMYMEDQEICYSMRKKGYKIYFYADASVNHIGTGSSNRTFAVNNIYKGLLYFYKKHKSRWEYEVVKIVLYTKALVLSVLGKITKNSYLANTYQQAIKTINNT